MVLRLFPVLLMVILSPLSAPGQFGRQLAEAVSAKQQDICRTSTPGVLYRVTVKGLYGSMNEPNRRDWQTGRSATHQARGRWVSDTVWVLVTTTRRTPGSQEAEQLKYGLTPDENGNLYWYAASGGRHWATEQRTPALQMAQGVSLVDFHTLWARRRGLSGDVMAMSRGGWLFHEFGVYLEDGAPWTLPQEDVTIEDIQKFLAVLLRDTADENCGSILLNLSRLIPLNNVLADREARSLLSYAAHPQGRLASMLDHFRGQAQNEAGYLLDQAMLRCGFWQGIPGKTEKEERRHRRNAYAGFRLLAEDSQVPGESRRVAFERCLNTPRGIDFHQRWIELVKSGAIPYEAETRGRIVKKLREELYSRSVERVSLLALSFLGAFLLAIIFLRVLARRMLFGAARLET